METELNLLHQLICPALANPKRMQILYLLQDGLNRLAGLPKQWEYPNRL